MTDHPAAASNPAEAPVNDLPPGLHRKTLLAFLGLDDLDRDSSGRAKALAAIGAFGKAVGWEQEEPMRGAKQGDRAMLIVQVSG